MKKAIDRRGLSALRTRLSRRDLLGFAAKGAASVIVTQLTLATALSGTGYAGTINLGVQVG